MRSIAAALLGSLLLTGASCQERPDPPTSTVVKVPVPVPCRVPEPVCKAPAYDSARKEQEGDVKIKLLRAEAVNYEDCVRQYRKALQDCR